MLVIKNFSFFVALAAFASWPHAVSGFEFPKNAVTNPANTTSPFDENGDWKVGTLLSDDQKNVAGRDDSQICVSFSLSIEASDGFVFDGGVAVLPKGDTLTCSASGVENGSFYLEMNNGGDADFSGFFCSVGTEGDPTAECSLSTVAGIDSVAISVAIFYTGDPTTVELACTNGPCNGPGTCGDGFCNFNTIDPLEMPAPGLDGKACKEDCGDYCGDSECDTIFGENKRSCPSDCDRCGDGYCQAYDPYFEDASNCLRDCYRCLPGFLDDEFQLEYQETKSFTFDLMDGEYVFCEGYSDTLLVSMKYDEPPCPLEFSTDYPTPSPTSSLSPSYTPPCVNDCENYYSCGSSSAVSSQTLYVNVFAPYGYYGTLDCRKEPCDLPETDPPSPYPTGGPSTSPSTTASSAPATTTSSSPAEPLTSGPMSAPTASPTASPTTSPSVAPTRRRFPCFSDRSEVEVLGQGVTRMSALKIGDAVRSKDGSFSVVYSFGHNDPLGSTNFLQISTNATKRSPLEITGDHLLFVHAEDTKSKVLPASAIKVGDRLITPDGLEVAVVTSINGVERQGLYSPFTADGNLVVNGVAASSYIALPLTFQGVATFEQQHWLQHLAYKPYRLYCGASGCQGETYDETTGLSKAVMAWLPLLHFLEYILPWAVHGLAFALGYLVWKRQRSYKTSKAVLKN